jgi:hypothetical protein
MIIHKPERGIEMDKTADLVRNLANLLEWAKGNRGERNCNPYCVQEVIEALKCLRSVLGEEQSYQDIDTEFLSQKGNENEE